MTALLLIFWRLVGWLAAGARAVAFVVRSFFAGLTVILSQPVTLVTVACIALACYGLGIRRGMIIDGYLVRQATDNRDEWKRAHAQLVNDAENADNENKLKLQAALVAKQAALDELAKRDAAAPAAPAKPGGVRDAPKRAPAKGGGGNSGPGLFGVFRL